jgi:c-di-GMP-binding flagellar brake protein YcgR
MTAQTPVAAEPASEFPPTEQLPHGLSVETLALIAGDLGDSAYRIDNFAESLDWVRRIQQSLQAATLVVVNSVQHGAPEVHLSFSARIRRVNDEQQTLELDLPLASPPVGKGLALRGSVRVQGVIITFECETLGTELGEEGLPSVLRARLPFRLYRLQRRDSFRVPVPSSQSVFITLKPGLRHLENLKALDLSCGGVSVLVRAPLEAVHLGKRFPGATVKLGPHATNDQFKVDMLIRHVRLAPPGLSQLLGAAAPMPRVAAPQANRHGGPASREAALAAMGALLQPELLQLGIEFERMPTQLERNLARLVNELGVNLITRVKDDL